MVSPPRPVRIPPLPESGRDEKTKELLQPLQVVVSGKAEKGQAASFLQTAM